MLAVLSFTALVLVASAAYAVTKRCAGGECHGTNAADTLYGSPTNDTLFGENGDDRLYGGSGSDSLKGGFDNDAGYGGPGMDRVKGGPGVDRLYGGDGDDIMRGGLHNKTNDGVADYLDCGSGRDEVYFTPRVDTIRNCEMQHRSG